MKVENIPVLSADKLELVVSEKTIGSLTTNAKAIRELVTQALPNYDISHYSTDDIPKAKADKALLNKAAKTLNDKRIEFEREFMQPFCEFKEVVTETVKLIKEAVGKIDTVIKEDEQRTKLERKNKINELVSGSELSCLDISVEKIWNDKWMNKSTSMKQISEELQNRISTIKQDYQTLKTFGDDYPALLAKYKESLDLSATILYANNLKAEREKASETTQKPVNDEPKEDNVVKEHQQEQSTSFSTTDEDADAMEAFAFAMGQSAGEPIQQAYEKQYLITATDKQFKALEAFLRDENISFNLI